MLSLARDHFPLLNHYPELLYLDNASTTHKPSSVINAMHDYLHFSYANIHRGAYDLAYQSEDMYNQSKLKIARFISAHPREVAYSYNATHASNLLAQSLAHSLHLTTKDSVFIGSWDHHATIVPRQILSKKIGFKLHFIAIDPQTGDIDWPRLEEDLSTKKPKILVCSHVSNVTGRIYDIKRLVSCLSKEVFFVLDGSQAIPHFTINVQEIGCHAYFFTGHKMLGPTGIGVLRIQKDRIRRLETLSGGGGMIEDVTQQKSVFLRTIEKFESGTPNLSGAVGLGAACDFYSQHHLYDLIAQRKQGILDVYRQLLETIGYDKVVGGRNENQIGILSLNIENYQDLAEQLNNHKICVRVGGHCAHVLLQELNISHGVVRISPFVYNTIEELQHTCGYISSFVKSQ